MSWCPNCKNEYVDGIKVCADCGAELVEALSCADEEAYEETFEENCEENCEENFYSAEDMWQETESDIPQKPSRPVLGAVYYSSEKIAEENRSSAIMLLIIGGIGLVLMTLVFLEVIDLHLTDSSKYMICGGMSVLFLLFLGMGIASLKSSKKFEKKAKEENNLTEEIKKWCKENLTAAVVDEGLFDENENVTEEIKYFRRIECMKNKISFQFVNLDEGYLDAFIEDYYPVIFE